MEPAAPGAGGARPARAAAALALLVPLAVYAATLCPSVALVDSGELALAVHALAPGHPPGFPLYVLAAQVVKPFPGDLALRLNALSAVCQAVALFLAHGLFVGVLACRAAPAAVAAPAGGGKRSRRRRGPAPPPAPAAREDDAWLPWAALGGVLSLAFASSIWRWAVVTEVYGLHLLLLVSAIRAALLAAEAPGAGRLAVTGLLLGLAASNHLSAAVYGTVMVAALAIARPREVLAPRAAGALVGAGLAGLAPYAALPLLASRGPILSWGDVTSVERLLRHVVGWQYQSNLVFRAEDPGALLASNLRRLGGVLAGQQWLPWIAAGAAGVAMLLPRHRRPALALLAVNVAYALSYEIAEDWDAYFYPLYLLTGLGVARVLAAVGRRSRRAGVVAACVAALVPLLQNVRTASHRGFDVPRHVVRDHLERLPPGALVLTREWQLYAPSLYLQHVDGYRRDVTVIDVELMRRSWYYDYIGRIAPELRESQRATEEEFQRALVPFERSQPYDADLLQRLYLRLVNGYAAAREGRTYVGLDMEPGVGEGMAMVPEGLTFRLAREAPGVYEPAPFLPGEEAFISGRLPAAEGLEKVQRIYAAMRANAGIYLASRGRYAAARAELERSLRIDPLDEQVRAHLRSLPAAP